MRFQLLILSVVLLQVGCVSNPGQVTGEEEAVLVEILESVVVPDTDVLALNDEIKQSLDAAVRTRWSRNRKFSALRDLMFEAGGRNIQYDADTTGSAIDTWNAGKGNCLAITNLFIASARYVGLSARFQTVSVRPTWTGAGQTLIRYEHIIAVGRLSGRDKFIVDLLPGVSTGESETEIVSDRQAKALHYNNLGAEHVVAGDYATAIQHMLVAIKLWPENSAAWNNLGAAYRRSGDYRLAELSYKKALRIDRTNYSALANLTQIYRATNRSDEAEQFRARVDRYYAKNPYYHFYMARLHFSGLDYNQARDSLESAIKLKEDDPQFYLALSDTYAQLGEPQRAERLKQIAKEIKPKNLTYRGDRTRWSSVITRGGRSSRL